MKYVNANDVLPEKLLSMIQKYYQGGYLYIPKEHYYEMKQQTDYAVELEKRNQNIYLKHLEGRTNGQLGNVYHLSESSIRRIISKEQPLTKFYLYGVLRTSSYCKYILPHGKLIMLM